MTCPSTGLRRRSRRPRLRSAAAAHGDSVTCKAYPAFREHHAAEDPACPWSRTTAPCALQRARTEAAVAERPASAAAPRTQRSPCPVDTLARLCSVPVAHRLAAFDALFLWNVARVRANLAAAPLSCHRDPCPFPDSRASQSQNNGQGASSDCRFHVEVLLG